MDALGATQGRKATDAAWTMDIWYRSPRPYMFHSVIHGSWGVVDNSCWASIAWASVSYSAVSVAGLTGHSEPAGRIVYVPAFQVGRWRRARETILQCDFNYDDDGGQLNDRMLATSQLRWGTTLPGAENRWAAAVRYTAVKRRRSEILVSLTQLNPQTGHRQRNLDDVHRQRSWWLITSPPQHIYTEPLQILTRIDLHLIWD